jgi:hypothetical protein
VKQGKTMMMDVHHAEAEALERWLLACLTWRLKAVVATAKTTTTTWRATCLATSSKTATLLKASVNLSPARHASNVAASGATASVVWQCVEHHPRSHSSRSANQNQNNGCAS